MFGCVHRERERADIFRKYHLSLLASLSDSKRVRMSPSLTGPLTFLIIDRFESSKKSTLTCVHCPCDPVRPNNFVTLANVILSIVKLIDQA